MTQRVLQVEPDSGRGSWPGLLDGLQISDGLYKASSQRYLATSDPHIPTQRAAIRPAVRTHTHMNINILVYRIFVVLACSALLCCFRREPFSASPTVRSPFPLFASGRLGHSSSSSSPSSYTRLTIFFASLALLAVVTLTQSLFFAVYKRTHWRVLPHSCYLLGL